MMRPIERIDKFLLLVDWERLRQRWDIDINLEMAIAYSEPNVITYWKENPDQRIGEVLINLGIIPDMFEIWADNEKQILLDQGVPARECTYWTSVYDKYENVLSEPRHTLIKDLTTEHLYAIKSFCEKRMLPKPQVILDEINYREQKKGTD